MGKKQRNKCKHVQIFVEVFSGEDGLAKFVAARGFLVVAWDIRNGEGWDLLRPSNQRLLRGWLAEGVVWDLHLGTPCQTLTRARDRGPLK